MENPLKIWLITSIFLSIIIGCVPSTYTKGEASPDSTYLEEAFSSGTYLEKDRWDSNRTNIKSGSGVTEGYIKPDLWESDRLNVYDKYGKPTGTYIKKDRWQPDRWNIKKGS